jgi:hypothetical protein
LVTLTPLSEQEEIMQSLRLTGLFFVAAMLTGFQSSTARADATAWMTSAAACVPVNSPGLIVMGGAVSVGGGSTVTLYCNVPVLAGAFDAIEITYRAGGVIQPTPLARSQSAAGDVNSIERVILVGGVFSELIEISKTTGAETTKCGVYPQGSATVASQKNLCSSPNVDFNKNFYYVRIVLKSGIIAGSQEAVYGTSLISTR